MSHDNVLSNYLLFHLHSLLKSLQNQQEIWTNGCNGKTFRRFEVWGGSLRAGLIYSMTHLKKKTKGLQRELTKNS